MFNAIKKFLGPTNDSVKNTITQTEVVRASILSVISGSTIWAILSILWTLVQEIVSDPNFVVNFKSFIDLLNDKNYLALFVAIGTFVLDFLRRKYLHGN